jgi:hypothetical protein
MAMRDLQRLGRYWRRYPPIHELGAGYLGLKDTGPGRAKPDAITEEDKRKVIDLVARMEHLHG